MDKKKYAIYHGRWQLSTIIMMAPMFLLNRLGLTGWMALPLVQFVGAVIFWHVDKRIFEDE